MEQRIIAVLRKPELIITFPTMETFWRHVPEWKLKQCEVLLGALFLVSALYVHDPGTANAISRCVCWKEWGFFKR